MTLTLKDFIHQVLFQWFFVFLAIFGLGKVLWFCLTKVLGKNQSYTNSYWFCKNLQIGTKSGEKPSWQDTQKTRNFKKLQNIQNSKNSILSVKSVLLHF